MEVKVEVVLFSDEREDKVEMVFCCDERWTRSGLCLFQESSPWRIFVGGILPSERRNKLHDSPGWFTSPGLFTRISFKLSGNMDRGFPSRNWSSCHGSNTFINLDSPAVDVA